MSSFISLNFALTSFLFYPTFKSIIDRVFSFFLICVFSPLLIILYVLVKVKLGSPVLFRQQRPGYNTRPFYIYKFRTMLDLTDSFGFSLPDSDRLTPFGCFLRSTSLDELPELFNILFGHMSFVGPRPLLMQYLELYDSHQLKRHLVKPGITGYAQINGRNSISWEQKFDYDVFYVQNFCFAIDIRILIITIFKVLQRDGISSPNSLTATVFRGKLSADE